MSTAVGLCERCQHAHRITSAKGSTFWRCRVAERDKSWPKYHPLPVVSCRHYEPGTPQA